MPGKISDSASPYRHPLGRQEGGFHLGMPAVATQGASGRNHPMVGQPAPWRGPHDLPDGSRGSWPSGQSRDVAVGGDPASRDATDHGQDSLHERSHRRQTQKHSPAKYTS
jgi:hypothetical protein